MSYRQTSIGEPNEELSNQSSNRGIEQEKTLTIHKQNQEQTQNNLTHDLNNSLQ